MTPAGATSVPRRGWRAIATWVGAAIVGLVLFCAVFAPLIVPRGGWWNRPGPWQAIAACAVAGFAAYALLINTGRDPEKIFGQPNGDIAIALPPDSGGGSTQIAEANLASPSNNLVPGLPAVGGDDSLLKKPPVPKVGSSSPFGR